MINEKQKRNFIVGGVAVLSFIIMSYIGAIYHLVDREEKNPQKYSPEPVLVGTEECELKNDNVMNPTYLCKNVYSESVKPEAKNHFNQLHDTCAADLKDKNVVYCHNETKSDKVKDVEKKVRMTSITYNNGHKKYIRH